MFDIYKSDKKLLPFVVSVVLGFSYVGLLIFSISSVDDSYHISHVGLVILTTITMVLLRKTAYIVISFMILLVGAAVIIFLMGGWAPLFASILIPMIAKTVSIGIVIGLVLTALIKPFDNIIEYVLWGTIVAIIVIAGVNTADTQKEDDETEKRRYLIEKISIAAEEGVMKDFTTEDLIESGIAKKYYDVDVQEGRILNGYNGEISMRTDGEDVILTYTGIPNDHCLNFFLSSSFELFVFKEVFINHEYSYKLSSTETKDYLRANTVCQQNKTATFEYKTTKIELMDKSLRKIPF